MQNELLYEMQNAFPMSAKPFNILAKELNRNTEDIISMVQELKDEKIIRKEIIAEEFDNLGIRFAEEFK